MNHSVLVLAAVSSFGAASVASADFTRSHGPISTAAFTSGQSSGALRGPGNFFAGFETAEGYVVGPLDGQLGWATAPAATATQSVTTANPYAGNQNFRMVNNAGNPNGTNQLAFSPVLGVFAGGQSETSMQINLSNDGGADYDVVGQAPSQALLTWRVKFSWTDANGTGPGTIFILDDLGGGLGFVDTGVAWNTGAYTELRVLTDSVADTITYFYGGAPLYTGVAGIFAGTSVEQVVMLNDNFQLPGETGDFDNVSVTVPSPSALGLAGLGLLAAGRRRRR
ncbi:MAG: hypothetical protein KF745_05740 [Phycisphaeraceae bacterium]|nr:hypothetical protein [Phycisphaeraceae bacterium]